MASRRPADFRFPTEKQERAEQTARNMHRAAQARLPVNEAPPPMPAVGPADDTPDAYWASILADPRAVAGARRRTRPDMALRDIGDHVLRVECLKCFRIVEVQRADAMRLYGGGATWKDVGMALLEGGCQSRTGNRDSDGCWPDFKTT